MNDSEKQFIEHARTSLDERAARLGPHLASRLRAVRIRALEANQSRTHYGLATAAAAMLALVIALGIWSVQDIDPQQPPIAAIAYLEKTSDLQMLTSVEDQELIEDLDFYRWLAQQAQHSNNSDRKRLTTTG